MPKPKKTKTTVGGTSPSSWQKRPPGREVNGMWMPTELADLLEQKAAQAAGKPLESGPGTPLADVIGKFIELSMDAEMREHLGYPPHEKLKAEPGAPTRRRNTRNGHSSKKLKTSYGTTEIQQPRDRDGSFEPRIVERHKGVSSEIEPRIISMYASGMTTEEIAAHMRELYGNSLSSSTVSRVIETVEPQLRQWRNRPLESLAAVLYVDAVHMKVRHSVGVRSTAVYIASAYLESGLLEVIGVWIAPSDDGGSHGESGSFWFEALNDLRNRGLETVLFACSDDLNGLQEAIETVWPTVELYPCIVHAVRSSLRYVPYKQRKEVAAALKAIYAAQSYELAEAALEALDATYGRRHQTVVKQWRDLLPRLRSLWALSTTLRRIVYTSNPLENINRQVRKVTKNRGVLPSADSALRLCSLVLRTINDRTTDRQPRGEWPAILNELHARFGDRLPKDWGHRLRTV